MGRALIILNPIAGRGYGSRAEPEIRRLLHEQGLEFDVEHTVARGHAVELAGSAAASGYDLVVAGGGDGTFHEVVNGLMGAATTNGEPGVAGTLGVLPIGSGSDFANTVGVPPDLPGACRRLAHGEDRLVDVGRVTMPGCAPEYFDNTINIGFGGVVTREAQKVRWLRGTALYLPVVLKTVFLYYRAPQVTIEYDDEEMSLPAVMVCVANGPREGGGFHVAPDASPDDGLLDVCVVREISRLQMLGLIPYFMSGTHCDRGPVTMLRARRISVRSEGDLIAHADGEMLCTQAHQIEFEVLPRTLRVRC
jgi:YegS/Rv2252/BmrU family lipid kinase